MTCSVVNSTRGRRLSEMSDGDMGEVTMWQNRPDMIGKVVQRYADGIIVFGVYSGNCYPNICSESCNEYRVRILKKGEIIVVDN